MAVVAQEGDDLKKVARKLRANCCSPGGGSFRLAPALGNHA